jgi:hypothetical protein
MQEFLTPQQERQDWQEECSDFLDVRYRQNGLGQYDQSDAEPGDELEVFAGEYMTRLPAWLPYGSAYCTRSQCQLHWRDIAWWEWRE